MERMKVHGLQPSPTEGQVLTTVDGETVWADGGGGSGDVGEGSENGQVLTWVDGEAVWQIPSFPPATTYLVPLTTVIAGEPVLVWTEDNQLVFVEETL